MECGLGAGLEPAEVFREPPIVPDSLPYGTDERMEALSALQRWDPLAVGCMSLHGGRGGRRIMRIGSEVIVKYSLQGNENEYGGLGIAHEACPGRVPRPLYRWAERMDGRTALAMTAASGDSLDDEATSFDEADLRAVSACVREVMPRLRAFSKPVAQGTNGPLARARYIEGNGVRFDAERCGKGLIAGIVRILGSSSEPGYIDAVWLRYSEYLSALQSGSEEYVMTHGDLHPNNFVVDRSGPEPYARLVDWELSSYMPRYWEHFSARFMYTAPAWTQCVVGALDRYDNLIGAIYDMYKSHASRRREA